MTDKNDATPEATAVATVSKPATTKLSLGAQLAKEDPEILMNAVIQKREELLALADDPSLPDPMRQVVRNLAGLALPSRPGLEEMDGSWNLPRISIAQPTSRSDAKPEAAKNGSLYTTSGQLLELPWGGIPIHFSEENINFPKGGGNVPVCQAPDAQLGSPFGECLKCPHLPYGKQNGGRGDQKPTDCYSNIVVIMLAMDMSNVYKVQFGKTSRRTGNALLALARQQLYVWKQSYLLNTEKKTGDQGIYWIYKVEPTGKDNSPDVQKLCEKLYGLYNAERRRFLADWYSRPQRAPQAAVEGEAEFAGGALDAGIVTGAEPDFTTPPPNVPTTSATTGKGARSSSKPM